MTSRALSLAIFAVAFAVRVANVLSLDAHRSIPFEHPVLDAAFYDEWARRIAGGEWIGTSVFQGVPLYGYFLALVYATLGSGPVPIAIVQAAIGAAGVVCLWLFTRSTLGTAVGLVVAGVSALYAPFVFYESFRLADGIATFFTSAVLLASLGLLRRPTARRALAMGALVGVAALARERFLLFAPVLVAMLVWRHRRGVVRMVRPVIAVALFVFGLALPLGLSLAHNLAAAGDPVLLSSAGGVNFFIGNRPGVTGSFDSPAEFGVGRDELYRRAHTLAEAASGRALRASESSAYWTRRGLESWATAPGALLAVVGRKLSSFWKGYEMWDAVDYYGTLPDSAVLSLPLPSFYVLGPLALVGLVLAWGLRRRDAGGLALLYGMLGTHVAFLLLFFVTSRFRLSATPCLLPFAGATIVWIVDRLREWRILPVLGAGIALALAAVFTSIDPSFVRNDVAEAMPHLNRGELLYREKRYDDAERELREALRLRPAWSAPAIPLARVLADTGRSDDAVRLLDDALARSPSDSRVLGARGEIRLRRREPERALADLLEAARLEPGNGWFHFNVATAHQQLGRTVEAAEAYRRAADLEPAVADEARRRLAALQGH